ncbi:hypothetical protein EYF80_026391 [Liparis tanakae]|uniref:Uncharacterized protein n=1 Tax=Liparis tanakae TaxID=230148 RepID=A0A4Z2HC19_9TELE|nr:hypothetical protein EYF80_026391 [Liparis tanakae]
MKSSEVSGGDTGTGGLGADEVLDTETRQSAAAPGRRAKRSQQWNSPLKMHRLEEIMSHHLPTTRMTLALSAPGLNL